MDTPLSSAVARLIPPAALACIPGWGEGLLGQGVSLLAGGGQLNRCVLVCTPDGRFVVRLRIDQASRPGAVGSQELACQRVAAAAGLAPPILASAPDAGWVVMPFVEGALWQVADLASRERVARLGERLAELHALAPPAVAPLDALAIIRAQVRVITQADPSSAEPLARTLERARGLSEACGSLGRCAVLNHGDVNVANLIGPQPVLIDWEYAQVADPLYDVACLLSYYPGLRDHLDWLLGGAMLGSAAERRVLEAHLGLFEVLNGLWSVAQGAAHGDAAGLVAVRPAE